VPTDTTPVRQGTRAPENSPGNSRVPTASTADLLARLNDYRAMLPKANTLEKMKMAQGAAELTLELLSAFAAENAELRSRVSNLEKLELVVEPIPEGAGYRIVSVLRREAI
jgi:hypothetical protein